MATKEELKKIPGFSQGVRVNSAMRMIKLAAPVCPNSQRVKQSDGTFKEIGQNCQLAGGRWWEACEALGHNPYFTTTTYYETVDIKDEEGFITGTKKKPVTVTRPNINQVPVARRMHSGRGAINSIERKGRKRLRDIGYEEVCQFRNCQRPIDPRCRSRAFGDYCSTEHLSLVAADQQSIMLPQVGGFEGANLERVRQERAKELREAVASADLQQ